MIYRLWGLLGRWKHAIVRWHYRNRPPPYRAIPGADPLGDAHGEHQVIFVSRHDLAECGLKCDNCRSLAADRGDFSKVFESQYGEAVQCSGCDSYLVASPDTEHGDDLLPYDKKAFHRFKRITEAQAVRERYGDDMERKDGQLQAKRIRLGDIAEHMSQPEGEPAPPPEDDPRNRKTNILPAIKEP